MNLSPTMRSSRGTRRRAAAALLLVTALAACSAEPSDLDDRPDARSGEGWTVLHYSMADTDLEPFMVEDLNEMGEVGSQGGLQLRAFMDRSTRYGKKKALDRGNWTGAKVLDLEPGGTTTEVADLGDVDSADPDVLADFIATGIADRPAQKYALIISDHGASWPGIGPDEGSDDSMLDLADLTRGVREGLKRAGLDRLDLIGFDACLMAGYEVASAMAPLARRMVASQELEPGHGWDYASLEAAVEDPDLSADDLGRAIIDGFAEQAKEEDTQESITLALLDLDRMDAVDDAVADLATALDRRAADVSGAVGRAAAKTLGFARSPDEEEDAHLLDLGLLAGRISVEAVDVADEAEAVVQAIGDLRVDSVAGKAMRGASGLSIYFPPTAELADDAYADVTTAKRWRRFLDAYYGAGDDLTPAQQADLDDDTVDVERDDDGFTISAAYDPAIQDSLVEATVSYAVVEDDGTLTYLGEEYADLGTTDEPVAFGVYDNTRLTISDGEDTVTAYLQLERGEQDGFSTINVPMAYYGADDVDGETYQDALLTLVLDDDGELVSEVYYTYDEDSGTYGELTPDPEGIIVPEVLTVDADGEQEWTATSDTGLYAALEDLTYDVEPLEPGTRLRLELTATDVAGGTDTVSREVTVR